MQPQEYIARYLEVRGIEAVYVFSADGMQVASAAKETWVTDPDTFVAATAQAASFGQELGEITGARAHTMMVEYNRFTLVVQELPEIGYVAIVAAPGSNIGLLRVYCARLRQGLIDSFEPA